MEAFCEKMRRVLYFRATWILKAKSRGLVFVLMSFKTRHFTGRELEQTVNGTGTIQLAYPDGQRGQIGGGQRDEMQCAGKIAARDN